MLFIKMKMYMIWEGGGGSGGREGWLQTQKFSTGIPLPSSLPWRLCVRKGIWRISLYKVCVQKAVEYGRLLCCGNPVEGSAKRKNNLNYLDLPVD